jgi:hypothetical protein
MGVHANGAVQIDMTGKIMYANGVVKQISPSTLAQVQLDKIME